jgi:NADH-quinone oxidoreductase subunit I
MGYFSDGWKAMKQTLKSAFRKPTTVEFPKQIRPRAERYRASFALLHDADGDEACIGCLQCERICPSQVIKIKAAGKKESPITKKKRGYADDFVLDLNACIFCELCVQVCPTDAIVMTREQELPAYGREDLVLTMARLYENEKKKTRAWGDGTRLMDMQDPKKGTVAPAPAAAAPAAGAPSPEPRAPSPAAPKVDAAASASAPAAAPAPAAPKVEVAAPVPATAPVPEKEPAK